VKSCIDCASTISSVAHRCWACHLRRITPSPSCRHVLNGTAANFGGGKCKSCYNIAWQLRRSCIDCAKPVTSHADRCRACSRKRRTKYTGTKVCDKCQSRSAFCKDLCRQCYAKIYRNGRGRIAELARVKAYALAHPEVRRRASRMYWERHRDSINKKKRFRERLFDFRRARKDCIGRYANGYKGGHLFFCSYPGCDEVAGWRTPSQIVKNRHGFYCSEHAHVYLKGRTNAIRSSDVGSEQAARPLREAS